MEVRHSIQIAETHLKQQTAEFENGEQVKQALERSVQSVLGQRQDVLEQLERQNVDHDDMRRQIEEARARMIESNNHERRLLAFKVLFRNLEVCIYNRRLLTL